MSLNWEAIARAAEHPTRIEILQWLAEVGEGSPIDATPGLGVSLGTTSHHFRALRKRGLIEIVRTDTRRGAVKHWYRLTDGME